jgi:UDP-3-O-[3-hydroxymyristoyl] glucosamine N-acyltransferase
MPLSLAQLATRIGATLEGSNDRQIVGCAPIDKAGPSEVTFLANPRYLKFLESTQAAAVIVGKSVRCPNGITRLVADDPYFAFRQAMIELHGFRRHPPAMDADSTGVSRHAVVHPGATLGEGCAVHPNVVIEAGAAIGRGCVLYPGVYIGADATLGDECVLFPNVAIYERCKLGHRVTLHANTVIGQDGFGYATHDGVHNKIPQTGIVVIGDDVELGAGCAIERSAMGETRIGNGTKFADLISIGHGTTMGEHCLVVSLVGISGSVEIGNYVALGGQVGITGHLRIGNMVQAAGKSAIVADVPDGAKVGGIPAIDIDKAKRNALAGLELYELAKRVKKLEKAVQSEPGSVTPRVKARENEET